MLDRARPNTLSISNFKTAVLGSIRAAANSTHHFGDQRQSPGRSLQVSGDADEL
jgi:hypothetical protein